VSVINNQSKEAFYARLAQTPLSALPYCRQRVTIVFRETANSSSGKCSKSSTLPYVRERVEPIILHLLERIVRRIKS
jgi:hypothetical protein